mmetsp:Transcript_31024/g.72095  ORF Transcript_31024/g.72095 Transcript_31024/m.72095 type:complete len:357 (-) Transcript_31024:2619-3689(-)
MAARGHASTRSCGRCWGWANPVARQPQGENKTSSHNRAIYLRRNGGGKISQKLLHELGLESIGVGAYDAKSVLRKPRLHKLDHLPAGLHKLSVDGRDSVALVEDAIGRGGRTSDEAVDHVLVDFKADDAVGPAASHELDMREHIARALSLLARDGLQRIDARLQVVALCREFFNGVELFSRRLGRLTAHADHIEPIKERQGGLDQLAQKLPWAEQLAVDPDDHVAHFELRPLGAGQLGPDLHQLVLLEAKALGRDLRAGETKHHLDQSGATVKLRGVLLEHGCLQSVIDSSQLVHLGLQHAQLLGGFALRNHLAHGLYLEHHHAAQEEDRAQELELLERLFGDLFALFEAYREGLL